MTRWNRMIFIVLATLPGTAALTYVWFNTILLVPLSERVWTFYNDLLGGENPGGASDLELLTVLLGSMGLAFGIARVSLPRLIRSWSQEDCARANDGHDQT